MCAQTHNASKTKKYQNYGECVRKKLLFCLVFFSFFFFFLFAFISQVTVVMWIRNSEGGRDSSCLF